MHSIDRRSALKLSALAALAPASLYLAGCAQSASSDEPAVIGGSQEKRMPARKMGQDSREPIFTTGTMAVRRARKG